MKKQNLLIALIMLFFLSTSCEKEDKDERDKFVGTWKGTFTTKIPEMDYENTQAVEYEIEKVEGTEDKLIVGGQDAFVNGNTYTYEDFTETQNSDGTTMTMEVTGGGSLEGSVISESGTLTINAYGEQLNGSWSSTLNKQ